jgi:hypothetical protein
MLSTIYVRPLRKLIDSIVVIYKKYGKVTFLTLFSQGISTVNILLFAWLGLKVSDIYSVGLQAGTGAYAGFVIGVTYLLAVGRPNFNHWRLFGWLGAACSFIVVTIAKILIANNRLGGMFDGWQVKLIFASFAIGGAALALSGTRAVRIACAGDPRLLAGSVIGPNSAMLVVTAVVAIFLKGQPMALVLPAITWALMNVVQVWWYLTRPIPAVTQGALAAKRDDVKNQIIHAVSLIVGVLTSTVLPTFYITAVTKLPSGATTLLFFCSRVGLAAITLGVNSFLIVRYNWSQSEDGNIAGVAKRILSIALALALSALVMRYILGYPMLGYVFVLLAWLATIVAAPVVMREVNARRQAPYVLGKVVLDFAISVCAATILTARPSATGYFAAYMVSQCVTSFVCGLALRRSDLSYISVPVFAASLALLFVGW